MSKNNQLVEVEITSSDATNNIGEMSLQTSTSKQSTKDPEHNLRNSDSESSDDEPGLTLNTKKRVKRFSDSESDTPEETNEPVDSNVSNPNFQENSDNEDSLTIFKSTSNNNKSRIRKMSVSEEEASDTKQQVSKNIEQQIRMKNKTQKLKDKFKTLVNSRGKDSEKDVDDGSSKPNSEDESNSTEDEMSSIEKIKQKIKERSESLKMTICDPDTSDEECTRSKKKGSKSKKGQKLTKLTSPQPQRMSTKQAMENMQKIKSESNRMLREKEVSLPYHRPKALSLQDIMKRRRPAVSSDGKALPIKMNEDQLKQYAQILEQRQKEMMELCKSDTEEDEPPETNESLDDNGIDDIVAGDYVCNIMSKKHGEEPTQKSMKIPPEDQEPTDKILTEINAETSQLNNNDKDMSAAEITDNHIADSNVENTSGDLSAEMELVYNDSLEEDKNKSNEISTVDTNDVEDSVKEKESDEHKALSISNETNANIKSKEVSVNNNKAEDCCGDKEPERVQHDNEMNSQLISLRYLDSEKIETINAEYNIANKDDKVTTSSEDSNKKSIDEVELTDFPDEDMDMDEINMDEIDSIIENAEIIKNTCDGVNSPALIKDTPVLSVKPKLTGVPGMVIDLDGTNPTAPKKLSGVELLKERFTFYARLKTPEEMEREREKRQKPGTLHLKLKQELEEKMAEQRSLEWSKRLDNEKQQQKELSAIRGDESGEDEIDKIELKLNKNDIIEEESSSESEEELLEDDVFLEDKPKKRNHLVVDEAEESDVDEIEDNKESNDDVDGVADDGEDDVDKSEEDSSEEEQSSESEDEIESNKPKKGRILKAFEDSDDEESPKLNEENTPTLNKEGITQALNDDAIYINNSEKHVIQSQSEGLTDSQDDVLQLAQIPKQTSGELFTSSDCANAKSQADVNNTKEDELIGTQTFSILNTNSTTKDLDLQFDGSDKLTVISETQSCDDNLDAVVGMCSGSFSQNFVEFKPPSTQSQLSQSQPIGEDILNMCTGNFYDNQFVTQLEGNDMLNTSNEISQEATPCVLETVDNNDKAKKEGEDILKSVLDELNESDIESTKPLKFFFDGRNQNKENEQNISNTQMKKRLVIDSDDEINENADGNSERKKNKKIKKKKLEERALQISDDEEEEYSDLEEEDEYLSERENEEEKLVEYDSEENEVEVKPQVVKKKKKKASEFFEQEAELTSEDEWVGSGDEDEAGLDRMEREAGDDDTFHQGRLQRELGQIHMRDVLDQDKREVRLIQELLFEDGDLGAGGRQRKFRWRQADGEEASGTVPDEFADTQEEEFESEEQWRKQRHEREMFLRQMKNEGEKEEEDLNVSVNRTTIIKANLTSRTMSSLLEEVNQTKTEVTNALAVPEKKTTKDIPSPKKPFTVFQQNYHGSLLTRGRGALARLAALATPLVADDDAPKAQVRPPASNRNFVFATITPEEKEPKVPKRKAESNVGTPRLVKKMKTEEKQNFTKSSLLDHLKA